MRIVLREAANASEPVQRPAAFETIHRAELGIAQRQIAVRPPFAAIDENVSGAIHRFEAKALPFNVNWAEHRVRVVFEMPGNLEEMFVNDVGGDHLLIS